MNIENYEIEIIDSLLSNEFSDIESFTKKHCNLEPEELTHTTYRTKYGIFEQGSEIFLPENEDEAYIKLKKYEKIIPYLKKCDCIDLIPQSISPNILPVFKINPENNLPRPYDGILEIIYNDRNQKIKIFDELRKFKDRNYRTEEQYEKEIIKSKDKKSVLFDKILNRTNIIITLLIIVLAFILTNICNKNNQNQKSSQQNVETKIDSTNN